MPLNYERIVAHRAGPLDAGTDERTCILYALGIGIGMDPTNRDEIKFVHERELVTFPTLASVLGWPGRLTDPAFGIDARMVVAASLKVTLNRPLRTQEKLTSDPRVVEIVDKGPGKHAILQSSRSLVAPGGEEVAIVENTSIARGHGGFGGRVTDMPEPPPTPERTPDAVCDLPTPPNLALRARKNPASRGRSCTAPPPSVSPRTRCCARSRATIRRGWRQSRRASHARCSPAKQSVPRCGGTEKRLRFVAGCRSATRSCSPTAGRRCGTSCASTPKAWPQSSPYLRPEKFIFNNFSALPTISLRRSCGSSASRLMTWMVGAIGPSGVSVANTTWSVPKKSSPHRIA